MKKQFKNFKDARRFVHSLGLESEKNGKSMQNPAKNQKMFQQTQVEFTKKKDGLVGEIG